MSKVLFRCAIVGHLLILYCAATLVTKTIPTKHDGPAVILERVRERREKLLDTISELLTDSKSQNTKISKDDYVRIKKITKELFSDPLQKHLSTSRKLEKVPHNKKPNESRGQELFVPEDPDDTIV